MKKYRIRLLNGDILWKTNDKEMLDKVIERLIKNGVKYTLEVVE